MFRAPAVRALPAALSLALTLALPGCTGYHAETAPVPQVMAERTPRAVRIVVGSDRRVELFSPVLVNDTLRGHPRAASVERLSFPVASIRSISTRRFSLGKTVLMLLAVGGGLLAYDLMMSLNSTSGF